MPCLLSYSGEMYYLWYKHLQNKNKQSTNQLEYDKQRLLQKLGIGLN